MAALTLAFLQRIIREEYPDVTLQHFENAPATKRGDNYTSTVYRITLLGTKQLKKVNENGEIMERWIGSLIYKCLPDSVTRRSAFKSVNLFRNEVAFYFRIWPALASYQSKCNLPNPFEAIPKCYLARDDLIILRDLKQHGFRMPDRTRGLQSIQSYYILKQLAHFHALSFAMKYDATEQFKCLVKNEGGVSEVFFLQENTEYYKDYYEEAIRNAIEMVEYELRDRDDKHMYIEKFRQFTHPTRFFQTMVNLVVPEEPLAVFCHGDFWTNNMLFRYADDSIAEACLVDFQLSRYSSLAIDLVYLVYLCLDRNQRMEHLSSLLDYYSEELHKRLFELTGPESVVKNSLEKDTLAYMVQQEFKKKALFGLGMALDMYPIMTCDSAEAPNLYQAKEPDYGQSSRAVGPVCTHNAACRQKMTDLVVELVDEGLL